jgi:DNA-binding GntR family transcriptional regulator
MGIEVPSVTNSVVEYLRAKIVTGELVEGQKLNENLLSSLLGISRPPIREAFRILEHEHLISSIPRKGVFVSEANVEDCDDVYSFREIFECHAIDLLKVKGISDLPKVWLAHEMASGLPMPPENDPDQRFNYLKIFSQFHIQLVEAARSARLVHFYKSLQSTLWRFQFLYLSIPGSGPSSIEEHRQILDAIKNGAYDEAKSYMVDHIRHTLVLLKNRIQEKTK